VGRGSVERVLEEYVAACRGEVERLRGEVKRIGLLLTDREGELERLLTAQQVLASLPRVHPPTELVVLPAARAGQREPGSGGAPARAVERERFTAVLLDGDPEVPREVEKVRHHLKREMRAGRVLEREPGQFTLARGVAVVDG
jgi:hypothetical protein